MGGKSLSGKDGKQAATLREVWRAGAGVLKAAGVEAADLDAELLLLHLLGKSKAEWLRDWGEPWPPAPELEGVWEALLRRRAAGEPVQYVIGAQYFYGRPFTVNRDVLIPRPETELLAEAILAEGDRFWSAAGPHVLDVGTGSGALAVTLALERPAWRVTASDLSAAALATARRNAASLGAGERIRFVRGNLLEPFIRPAPSQANPPIDILVSNPPYIPSGDLSGLQREVRDYEPRLALDGGDDGLAPYRRMAEQLRLLPAIPRIVGWEVGAGQAEDVAALLRSAADWADIRFVADYAGILRHVIAVGRN